MKNNKPLTPSERKANERSRKKLAGFSSYTLWIHETEVNKFKKCVAQLKKP